MSISEERMLGELPEARASSFKMVLGVVGAIVGLGVLFCSGVAAYVAWTTTVDPPPDPQKAASQEPEYVRQLTHKIALLDMPDGFEPMQGEDGRSMTQVCYVRQPGDGAVLKLARLGLSPADSKARPQDRISMMLQMLEMGDGATSTLFRIAAKSPERILEVSVLGEKYPFRFVQGTIGEHDVAVSKVMGGVMTKTDVIVLVCMLPEAEFDESAIVKLIESLRHPQGEAAVSAGYSRE